MKRTVFVLLFAVLSGILVVAASAQEGQSKPEIPQPRREEALAKFLEGQRNLYKTFGLRGKSGWNEPAARAAAAFTEAARLDPTLAEAYTALAELSLATPLGSVDEGLKYASLALAIDGSNFGANLIQARVYTTSSRLNDGELDATFAKKAVERWQAIARLDPRNAEAWAFLSEFFRAQGKTDERIDALRKWLASSAPVEVRFYQSVLGADADLSPEAAGVKLGEALLDSGRTAEAIEVLNNAVANTPEDPFGVDLLRQALDLADSRTAASAVQTLEQVVFANPDNKPLLIVLARVLARAGRLDDAVKLLSSGSDRLAKLAKDDKEAEADAALALGDIQIEAGRVDEAVKSYRLALAARGVSGMGRVTESERDFFVDATDRIVRALKFADRFDEARRVIEESRKSLAPGDSSPDTQTIALLGEIDKSAEALQLARSAKIRFPDDPSFLRAEARLLASSGKVDDGAKLIRALMGRSGRPVPAGYDDFANWIFISMLYSSAGRSKEAVDSASEAVKLAVTDDRRWVAELNLSVAHKRGGDIAASESILRRLLKELPGNPTAQNNLAFMVAERGTGLDEALDLAMKAVKTDPRNSNYLDTLGYVHLRMGNLELARDYLTRALVIDPVSSATLEHLGDLFLSLNDAGRAKEYWQRALKLNRDNSRRETLRTKLAKPGNR